MTRSKRNVLPMWMNSQLCKWIKTKAKFWKKYKNSNDYCDLDEYRHFRNLLTMKIRQAKMNFEEKLANDVKVKSKLFYKYVCSKTKHKDTVGALKDTLGKMTVDDKEKCQLLNEYFSSVFTNTGIPLSSVDQNEFKAKFVVVQMNPLDDIIMTESDIKKVINKLKANRASGPDSITTDLLKNTVETGNLYYFCFRSHL